MFTFIKANIASILSSLFDYMITIIAVQFFNINVITAGIAGTLCGGIFNFIIGRNWVFTSNQAETTVTVQAQKYFFVWAGNLLLNASGMYLFTKFKVNYILAKLVTSIFVAVCYNYPLQKKYVFKTNQLNENG